MSKPTLRQLEARLIALRADASYYADRVRGNSDLTPDGQVNQHAGWGKQRRWSEQYSEIEAQMHAALESAKTTAATKRAAMTDLVGDDTARNLAETRHARRTPYFRHMFSKGAGPTAEMIAGARDEDVPLILESVNDHAATLDDTQAAAFREAAEHALTVRDEDYGRAAKTAAMSDSARHIVEAQLETTLEAISDPNAKPPRESGLAVQSVDVCGEDVGDLAA